jgi:heptosyltransferase-2
MPQLVTQGKQPLKGTLVIQPLPAIGDMIWHVPFLKAIAQSTPEKKITLLAKETSRVHQFLGHEDFIKEILWLAPEKHKGFLGGMRLGQDLKSYAFQEVWILHHSWRYYVGSLSIPSRKGYGFSYSNKFLLNQGKTLEKKDYGFSTLKRIEKFSLLNGFSLKKVDYCLSADPLLIKKVHQKFGQSPRPWVCFGIGASQTFKTWEPQNFAKLADYWLEKQGGTIFLCGAPNETSLAETILTAVGKKNIISVTNAGLDEMGALLSQADFFIGNDSGLLNYSANLGKKSIGLFGATEVLNYNSNIYNIQPPQSKIGMNHITVSSVIKLIEKLSINLQSSNDDYMKK